LVGDMNHARVTVVLRGVGVTGSVPIFCGQQL
jgi:hypothetical protein